MDQRLAILLMKAGDVDTNPGPTTTHKQVWIFDICHKQIHVRKISIRCNMTEPWVHQRCTGIRQAQYTNTWTCHLHRESGLTTHTDITPPHPSRPWSKPPAHSPTTPPTPPQPKHRHCPCSHRIGKAQTQSSHPLTPPLHPCRPEPNTYTSHIIHQLISSHARHSSIARQLH